MSCALGLGVLGQRVLNLPPRVGRSDQRDFNPAWNIDADGGERKAVNVRERQRRGPLPPPHALLGSWTSVSIAQLAAWQDSLLSEPLASQAGEKEPDDLVLQG